MCRFMVHDKMVCCCTQARFFFHCQSNWNQTESKSNTHCTHIIRTFVQAILLTNRRKSNLSNRCENQINFSSSEIVSMRTFTNVQRSYYAHMRQIVVHWMLNFERHLRFKRIWKFTFLSWARYYYYVKFHRFFVKFKKFCGCMKYEIPDQISIVSIY